MIHIALLTADERYARFSERLDKAVQWVAEMREKAVQDVLTGPTCVVEGRDVRLRLGHDCEEVCWFESY